MEEPASNFSGTFECLFRALPQALFSYLLVDKKFYPTFGATFFPLGGLSAAPYLKLSIRAPLAAPIAAMSDHLSPAAGRANVRHLEDRMRYRPDISRCSPAFSAWPRSSRAPARHTHPRPYRGWDRQRGHRHLRTSSPAHIGRAVTPFLSSRTTGGPCLNGPVLGRRQIPTATLPNEEHR